MKDVIDNLPGLFYYQKCGTGSIKTELWTPNVI